MKKVFVLLVSIVFLFSFFVLANAKDCDIGPRTCGDWGGCSSDYGQSECVADCEFGYQVPRCDCKTGETSDCWCECVDSCADEWCKDSLFGFIGGECQSDKSLVPDCYYDNETSCEDGVDNDGDGYVDCKDKEDCEGEFCGKNKICDDGYCIEELPVCGDDCQWVEDTCWCGEEKTEVSRGEYCCHALSEGYDLEGECKEECSPVCSGGCDIFANPLPCYCGSRLIEIGEEKYCYNKKIYSNKSDCETAKAKPAEDKDGWEWVFTCPGEETICPEGAFCIENPLCAKSFEDLVNAIVRFLIKLAVAISPIMFIWAGILFVTAAGDPAKIQKARDVVLWTIIGLGIVLMSYAIINVIQEIFGG